MWGADPGTSCSTPEEMGMVRYGYPGNLDKVGRTTPIPMASIRLKLIREGMEDYDV